jgi:hypothetical protein
MHNRFGQYLADILRAHSEVVQAFFQVAKLRAFRVQDQLAQRLESFSR